MPVSYLAVYASFPMPAFHQARPACWSPTSASSCPAVMPCWCCGAARLHTGWVGWGVACGAGCGVMCCWGGRGPVIRFLSPPSASAAGRPDVYRSGGSANPPLKRVGDTLPSGGIIQCRCCFAPASECAPARCLPPLPHRSTHAELAGCAYVSAFERPVLICMPLHCCLPLHCRGTYAELAAAGVPEVIATHGEGGRPAVLVALMHALPLAACACACCSHACLPACDS